MIEQLKNTKLASADMQEKFIKEAEENLKTKVDTHIEEIINAKLKERHINESTDGDKVASVRKGIEHQ